MEINVQTIITIITSFGLGSLIALFVKSHLDKRNKAFEDQFSHKEKRYKALMVLMWASINPDSELKHLQQFRSDITTQELLFNELQLELYNGILYASDDVLKTLKQFISAKDYPTYLKVALAMRKDLYGRKSKLIFEDIELKEISTYL